MATPTAKSAAHAVATPPVSTPFSHLAAFSPRGQRSVVPSPQHMKKSPANSATIYGHPTSSSFGAMNFDSPTAAALNAMPPLSDLALDAARVGLPGMGNTMNGAGRVEEDEKKRKLQQIIDTLKVNKGRVSEEGIERLARRVGLECLWEDQMGSGGRDRTLIIAGTGLSLDIDFNKNVVGKVSLSFPESPDVVTQHAEKAGQILLRDLQLGPNESPFTKMLDKFSANLERLAALDRLSVVPALNCHEAIAGIYESLKRLHKWEVKRLMESDGKSEDETSKLAMCTKSGLPVMNAREHVGLSLDYWQSKHLLGTESHSSSAEPKTWSLIVECVQQSALVYPSVRVSDKWISTDIEKSIPTPDDILMAGTGPVLDWLDPENVLLPANDSKGEQGQLEGIDQDIHSSNPRFPDVMFVAKFNPAVVVPYSIASQIFASTGASMPAYHLSSLDSLIFPPTTNETPEVDGCHRRITRRKNIPNYGSTGSKPSAHHNTLAVPKLEYGFLLTEIPFSHPRQLVEMLPVLRQYAILSHLLEESFGHGVIDSPADDTGEEEGNGTIGDDYKAFMASTRSNAEPGAERVPLNVSLHIQPSPQLGLTFPFKNYVARIAVDLGMNGAITIISQNVLQQKNGSAPKQTPGRKLTQADLGKMLSMTEDLDIFAEFVRKRIQ